MSAIVPEVTTERVTMITFLLCSGRRFRTAGLHPVENSDGALLLVASRHTAQHGAGVTGAGRRLMGPPRRLSRGGGA